MTQFTSNHPRISIISTDKDRSDGLWSFFVLTFSLALLTWGVLAISQMNVASTANTAASTSPLAMILYLLGGFTPSIAGFVMAYRLQGRKGLGNMWQRFRQFNVAARWYLTMAAIPLFVQAATALIYALLGGEFVRPAFLNQPASLIPLVIATFLFGPLSEEFGWRGFAQDRVQARWGNLKGSLILGFLWSLWHLPLFFVLGSGQQETGNPALIFPAFTIQVMAMTILYTWIYNNTNRSIGGAIVFHFMINFGAVLMLASSEISAGFLYIANAGVMVLLAVMVQFFVRNK